MKRASLFLSGASGNTQQLQSLLGNDREMLAMRQLLQRSSKKIKYIIKTIKLNERVVDDITHAKLSAGSNGGGCNAVNGSHKTGNHMMRTSSGSLGHGTHHSLLCCKSFGFQFYCAFSPHQSSRGIYYHMQIMNQSAHIESNARHWQS